VERKIRTVDVQLTNLQQLRDALMSIWTKISEECFQQLVESLPQRIKAVLQAKEVHSPSKVYLIYLPASVVYVNKLYIYLLYCEYFCLILSDVTGVEGRVLGLCLE